MFNIFDVFFVLKKFFFSPIYYSLDPDPHLNVPVCGSTSQHAKLCGVILACV